MLWLAAAVALAAPTPPTGWNGSAVVQARATVRVISGVQLKLGSSGNRDAPPPRNAMVRTSDGQELPARLIEFE